MIDKKTGIVVEPCDVESLSEALAYMLHNPQDVKMMKDNIKSIWKPQVDWAPIVDEYVKCYKAKV